VILQECWLGALVTVIWQSGANGGKFNKKFKQTCKQTDFIEKRWIKGFNYRLNILVSIAEQSRTDFISRKLQFLVIH